MPYIEELPITITPAPPAINERELPRVENWAAMRASIKSILGSPLICVELSMEQLNMAIQDAIEFMQEYWGKGSFKDVMRLSLIANQREYRIEDEGIIAVLEIVGDSSNSYTPEDAAPFALERMIAKGGFAAATNSAFYDTVKITDIEIMHQTARDWQFRYGNPFHPMWNDNDKTLIVEPTPVRNCSVGLVFYRREKIANLFNAIQFRRLAAAYAGRQWAMNLRKFTMALPGGSSLNASDMLATWNEEITKWETQIRSERSSAFIVG